MLIRMSFGCCRPRRPKGDHMLSRISTCLGALILFIAIALAAPIHLAAQSHYGVVELGELGGTAGSANGINDRGWITGCCVRERPGNHAARFAGKCPTAD